MSDVYFSKGIRFSLLILIVWIFCFVNISGKCFGSKRNLVRY